MGALTVADRGPLLLAEAAVGAVRAVARVLPARLKKRIEDGVFHYVFQKTRVENDAYGWRPPPGGGEPPLAPGAPPRDVTGTATGSSSAEPRRTDTKR